MKSKISLLLFLLFVGLSFQSVAAEQIALEASQAKLAVAQSAVETNKNASRKEKMTMWVAKKIYKKMEKKAKKKGLAAPKTGFEDIIVLAGAIVTIVGIISIIGSVTAGLITAGIGLLIYILGKANGGSLSNIF